MPESNDVFLTKKTFSRMVENLVRESNNVSYMDAIIHICEKNGIELEDIKKFLTASLVGRLEAEARGLNYLPRVNTLDV
jgi:predicted DsbA family dithiol-disulfide isomerase